MRITMPVILTGSACWNVFFSCLV